MEASAQAAAQYDERGPSGVNSDATAAACLAAGINQPLDTNTSDDAESKFARKAALRKAGADFLERALQAKAKGQDPFAAEIPSMRAASSSAFDDPSTQMASGSLDVASTSGRSLGGRALPSSRRAAHAKPEDPDLIAFGAMFENVKLYVYMGLYVLAQGTLYPLAKGSLATMKTPGVLSFLHMLTAVAMLWLASSYDVFDVRGHLTAAAVKALAVRAAITGIQTLLLYGALLHSSVNMVLLWITLAPLLVDIALGAALHGRPMHPQLLPVLGAGSAAGALEVLLDEHASWLSFLMLCAWTASKAVEWFWAWLKTDPTLGDRLTDVRLTSKIREISDEEDATKASTTAFLVNGMPAVPVLLIGFLCLEGNEIVDHELSVPAVKMMLLSCACFATVAAAQLLLADRVSSDAKLRLRAAAAATTLVFNYMEPLHHVSILSALLASLSVGAALTAAWARRQGAALWGGTATGESSGTV